MAKKEKPIEQTSMGLKPDLNALKRLAEGTATLVATPNYNPLSSSGTAISGGAYEEEYLEALKGTAGLQIYDEMRRKDTQIKMLLSAVKFPILSGVFEIRPAIEGDPIAENHAKFIEFVLNNMDRPLSQLKNELLTMLVFGAACFERIHKIVAEPFMIEGSVVLPSFIGLSEMRLINAKTIDKYNFVDKKLESIDQIATGTLENKATIPVQFLDFFVLDKEGDNYSGISLIRPCYGPYFRKNMYLKLNAIGIEKFAIGIPVGTIPEGQENTKNRTTFENALADFCTHQSNYLIKTEGYEVDIKFNSYDPAKVELSIDNEDKRMAKSFLASFLELGLTTGGSQALSSDLSTFFRSSLEYIIEIIEQEFNHVIIPELIKLNFPDVMQFPYLYITGVTDTSGIELATIMEKLTGSGNVVPDMSLEEYLRKVYGLPDKSDEPNKVVSATPATQPLDQAIKAFKERKRSKK